MRFEFGDHVLDTERRELRRGGEPVALEPQVFDLLVYLAQHRDRVVSRDDLVAGVWGGRIVSDSAITTRINAARRAVGDSGLAQTVIRTVMRRGVRFVAPVTEHGAPAPASQTQPEAALPPSASPSTKPPLVVLPFRNATGDAEHDYLSEAVTADLTVDLSHVRDVTVISAAAAAADNTGPLDIRQIGRDMGVRYLVVGSIARRGERVRTNVQLLDAASGEQLWGDRFEHGSADGIENTITGRIAASLHIQLVRAEGRRAESLPQPDALALRLRATSLFFGSVAPEHTLAARLMLRQSVELDPGSAEAWARLAEIIVTDRLNRWNQTGEDQLDEAEEAVRRALHIEPGNALAHVAFGLIQRARGDHHLAVEAFNRAIEIDQNFALAYAHKGNALTLIGRPTEAQALVEHALRLNPQDPSLGIFHWILGRANFYAGDYEQAVSWLQRSVQARANVWYNRLYLISAYALLGKLAEAERALAEFSRRFPAPHYTLAIVRAQEGANPSTEPNVIAAR
ncbi:MAG TPA: tetratricopeptide repeat protein, partial [Stellaceae bacterium]|nr:tetratricopeptide repeat protein [Stellaceae bacterium]